MESPDYEFLLVREAHLDAQGGPLYPHQDHNQQLIPKNVARPPLGLYFGRIIGGGRLTGGRGGYEQYSLKKHTSLGPTIMDAELSLP